MKRLLLLTACVLVSPAWAEHAWRSTRTDSSTLDASAVATPESVQAYRQKIEKLKVFMEQLEYEAKHPPKWNESRVSPFDLNNHTNAVMKDPLFDWSSPVKGLLKRAIEIDSAGYAARDILRQTPTKQMSPGMIHAALQYLARNDKNGPGQVVETQLEILKGINNPEPFKFQFSPEIRIELDAAADFENWEPIVQLLADDRFQSVAGDTLKRSGFSIQPFKK